ncbi:MAG: WYL domain-containing protein [Nitrospiraceae bacterium]|nr:WYL domain-containing protein [Nitrospiraceae bacterium]
MARNNQMIRQWKLLQALETNRFGLTLKELSEQFEVTEMTVRRDLKGLEEVGFPIFADTLDDGSKKWRINYKVIHAPHVTFHLTEVLALYLSRELLRPLAGTQFAEGIRSCIDKAKSMFKPSALGYFRRLAEVLYVHLPELPDYSEKEKIIDICSIACEDEKELAIRYRSAGSASRLRTVQPYGLVYFHHALYLVARDPKAKELRTFKIDRIDEAELQDKDFQRPLEFDLSKIYEHSFGIFHSDKTIKVRVKLAPEAANAVLERKWHTSQKIEKHKDGSVIATYTLGDTTELKSWVLSFGRYVEVLAPKSLRTEIRNELAAAAAPYRG